MYLTRLDPTWLTYRAIHSIQGPPVISVKREDYNNIKNNVRKYHCIHEFTHVLLQRGSPANSSYVAYVYIAMWNTLFPVLTLTGRAIAAV
jgi:hypothetical protein